MTAIVENDAILPSTFTILLFWAGLWMVDLSTVEGN